MNKKLLVLTLALTMIATACTAAWLSTFEGYLAIAAPAIVQILEIVALAKGQVVSPAAIAKINADAAGLKTLVQSIDTASQQNLPNACAAFNVGVQTFATDLPTIEQIGQISNPTTQAQIQDALVLAESVIGEIETPLTACQGATPVQAKAILVNARIKSPSDFVGKYNSIMDRDAATKKYKLHIHSKLARIATLGLLK